MHSKACVPWLYKTIPLIYQINQINIDEHTRILLNHHFNTIHNSNMFQHLKGHFQGV
jgi:hypothetical protein